MWHAGSPRWHEKGYEKTRECRLTATGLLMETATAERADYVANYKILRSLNA